MLTRRAIFLTIVALSLVVFAPAGDAADRIAYTPEAFEAARNANKPILVEITATWCPVCKAQKPILMELTRNPKFKDLTVFEVDFDTQKNAVSRFKATVQSTLIIFKGRNEVTRSVGDTKPESIEALLDHSI